MMNTISKFFHDVINIFSFVPETGKLIVRAIAAKDALKFNYALSEQISTNQFGRRAAIAKRGDMVSITVLRDSQQISRMA
jgi:hypothetical protein